MRKISSVCALAVLLLIGGCASIPADPQAAQVRVTPEKAPKGCKYIGQVVGNQGNFFTGGWTSNKNLEEGAMNDLKNQASKIGANYVQLITNRAGNTGTGGYFSNGFSQTNVTDLGNAYHCPRSVMEG